MLRRERIQNEYFFGEGDGQTFRGPFTIEQVDKMIRADESLEEKIVRQVRDPGFGVVYEAIRYSNIPRFDVMFDPPIEGIISMRSQALTTVFSGPNNSGKSLILKHFFAQLGPRANLLTCNRFSQFDVINSRASDPNERRLLYENMAGFQSHGRYHEDVNSRQLDQIISGLNDEKQDALFDLAGRLLGSIVSLKKTEENNRMSPWYVDIDGQSLKYSSSGTRLLFTLLGNLFDDYYQVALIDEPEIGLSPRIQTALARALYDQNTRLAYFPHLKQIFVVTHSHLFLDRYALSNNFIVEKMGRTVKSRAISSVAEFHELQFGMLGNDFEHIFMPAALVVIEGPCDTAFLARVLTLHVPDRRVSLVVAHGDGGAEARVRTLSEGFGGLQSSPYRPRIFVVFDAKHSAKKPSILRQGVIDENIIEWTMNGIEWYYPKEHVAAIFKCTASDLADVNLSADKITVNAMSLSKMELSRLVVPRVTIDDDLGPELTSFLHKVRSATA